MLERRLRTQDRPPVPVKVDSLKPEAAAIDPPAKRTVNLYFAEDAA
jgi:hypothetical protein